MNRAYQYSEVAPCVPLPYSSRQTYTYALPASIRNKIKNFSVVDIQFGPRKITGVVTKLHNNKPKHSVREINDVWAAALTANQIKLGDWIAERMHGGRGFTYKMFFPPTGEKYLFSGENVITTTEISSRLALEVIKKLKKKSVLLLEQDQERQDVVLRQIIGYVAANGGQLLTIVPEKQFLDGPGMVYTAGLSRKDLGGVWHGVRQGKIAAVRGTQKALFLPFTKLSLVVIFEDSFDSHKLWDQYPRLHNLDVSEKLAQLFNCPVLRLGTHKSWSSYAALEEGVLAQVGGEDDRLPVKIIKYDFEDNLMKYLLPRFLLKKMREWVRQDKRVLLLSNRRDNKKLRAFLYKNMGKSWQEKIIIATTAIFNLKTDKFDAALWLLPEQVMSFPDFRSIERALVVGARINRLKKKGGVTYLITKRKEFIEDVFQKKQIEVVRRELAVRKAYRLPPYGDQLQLEFIAATKKGVFNKAIRARQLIEKAGSDVGLGNAFQVRGPYVRLQKKNESNHKCFLLCRGELAEITRRCKEVKAEVVELNPHRIL